MSDVQKSEMTMEATIGPEKRVYKLHGILREGEQVVSAATMIARAGEIDARLGEDDGQYWLDNQEDIPVEWSGKVQIVFTEWRHPEYPDYIRCLYWNKLDQRWIIQSIWTGCIHWTHLDRVLSREGG